jgi:hypothetical protein
MEGPTIKAATARLISPEEAELDARREWHRRMQRELMAGPMRTFRIDPLLAGDVIPMPIRKREPTPSPPPSQPAQPMRPAARFGETLLAALGQDDIRNRSDPRVSAAAAQIVAKVLGSSKFNARAADCQAGLADIRTRLDRLEASRR